jgi:hypothetical protein
MVEKILNKILSIGFLWKPLLPVTLNVHEVSAAILKSIFYQPFADHLT